MQFTYASLLALLAASATALKVTSPTNTTDVDFGKDIKVTWDSVSSDPSSFSIQVVNNAVYPSVSTNIADGVTTSSGSYTIKAGTIAASAGQGYQINLVSKDPNNTGILAQSGQFTAKDTAVSSATSGASSGTSSTSSAASQQSNSASAAASSTASAKASSVASSLSSVVASASSKASSAASAATASASKSASATGSTSTGAAVANGAPVAAAVGFFGVLALLA